jgi:transcriptional regulator with XRE-family HTH domain
MEQGNLKLGEKIRQRRVIKGYSQEYMAFQLDISQNAYSKIEREATELSVKRLFRIAEILETSVFELLPAGKDGTVFNLKDLAVYWERFKRRLKGKKVHQHRNIF